MNVICLCVDRLHSGFLGAYGNSWIETPAFDRLAGGSFVFDQALIDTPELDRLYRSYWQGWHALCPTGPPDDRPSLAAVLREAGLNTTLLTDERLVGQHPLAVDFDELIEIDPPWEPQTAESVEQTHLAKCFVEAIDWLESAREPFLLWCHLGAMGTTWDAPPAFRQAYWEEGDPQPTDSADVPDLLLPEDHDPDQLLAISQAYAAQVSLFDTCFGALLELLDGGELGSETLLVLTSSRGFPLGEHRRVGPCADVQDDADLQDDDISCGEALYGESIHVPLVLRFPDAAGASARSGALVGPADLWATLLQCCGGDCPPSPSAGSLMPIIHHEVDVLRDRMCMAGAGQQRAIRTAAWYLRDAGRAELFAKPDDRWEVNDVAVRCPEVAESLRDLLDQYQQTLPAGMVSTLPPLSEVLCSGLR